MASNNDYMTRGKYFELRNKYMRDYGENSHQVQELDNLYMTEKQSQGAGNRTVDASNQSNQGPLRQPTCGYSDSELAESVYFAERALDLTYEGQYLARKNHFDGDDE